MGEELTWLRERLEAMTAGPWVDGAGNIFAVADLEDGMLRDGECEVASCYGHKQQADESGIVVLRNLAPSMLAMIEAAEEWKAADDGIEKLPTPEAAALLHRRRMALHGLRDALDAFCAAVREEQDRC